MDYESRFDYAPTGRRRRTEDDPYGAEPPSAFPPPTRVSQMPFDGGRVNVGGVDFTLGGPNYTAQDYGAMQGGLDEYGLPVPVPMPAMAYATSAHDPNDPRAMAGELAADLFSRSYRDYNAQRAQRQASTPIPGDPGFATPADPRFAGGYRPQTEQEARTPLGENPLTYGQAATPADPRFASGYRPQTPEEAATPLGENPLTYGRPTTLPAPPGAPPTAAAPDTSFGAQYRGMVEDFSLAEQGRVREASRTAPDAEGNSAPMSRPITTPNGRISFVQVGEDTVWIYNHDRQEWEQNWQDDPKWRMFRAPRNP